MSDRYQGGVIRATPLAPTSSSASGIWTMEQQAKAQAAGDWPVAPVTVDPNFNQVSMLLGGEPANSLDYTAFSDASTNNFLITPSGNPYGTAFSPYNSTFSNYFDGTGDYLTVADNAALDLGSGDFTIEFWYQAPNGFTSNDALVTKGNSGGLAPWIIIYDGGGLYFYASSNGGAWDVVSEGTIISSGVLANKQWNHVAVTREGTSFRFFFNGSLTQTKTSSGTILDTSDSLSIGANIDGSNDSNVYISNLRIVKGTAVYTSAFTPPTAPLTAISGTSLLTCQSNRFIDNSANAFAITVNGNTSISGFIPFTDTDTTTGSGYFNASNAYLIGPTITLSGDFTIDFWVYRGGASSTNLYYFTIGDSLNANSLELYCGTSGSNTYIFSEGAVKATASGITPKVGAWSYVALTRSGTTLTMYLNGSAIGSTWTSSATFTGTLRIGAEYYNSTLAYSEKNLAQFRISNNVRSVTSIPAAPFTSDANTVLLTLQDRAANQNFGFLDTTKQNLITAAGNATQGTFSPFSQADGYWGNYFDGSGDYLSIPDSTAFDLGSGSFTLEAWINMADVTPSKAEWIISQWLSDSDNSWGFRIETSGSLNFYYSADGSNASVLDAASPGLVAGTWHHIAVVRNSSTLTIYVDGVSKASTSWAGTLYNSSTTVMIGNQSNTGLGQTFTGYISNARVVKGTAVYTSAFTPSTTPLTAISGTSLLTCQDNRFVDNSTNGFTVTPNGNVSVQSFGPFAPTDAYSPAVNGGSGYFDGSGDWLKYLYNSNTDFGTGDLTVEGWFNTSTISIEQQGIVTFFNGDAGSGADISYLARIDTYSVFRVRLCVSSTSYDITFSGIKPNTWYNFALVRSSGTMMGFLNGVKSGTTQTVTGSLNTSAAWFTYIGNYTTSSVDYPFNGYISNIRITKGVALYTATYTPPTAPFTPTSATSLLCNFTNAGVWDSAARNDLATAGNAQITTSISKFGSGSYYFDGTGDYFALSPTPELQLGSGDWTVEGWFYFNSESVIQDFIGLWNSGASGSSYAFLYYNNSLYFYWYDGASNNVNVSWGPLTNTWYNIAFSKSGSSLRIFVDGSQVGLTQTVSTAPSVGTVPVYVGGLYNPSRSMNGYIDDLRITKGVARYTTDFTPANYPFPVK